MPSLPPEVLSEPSHGKLLFFYPIVDDDFMTVAFADWRTLIVYCMSL